MAAEKKVNYTESQTASLIEGYNSGKTVEELALEMGRAVRSVRAKLVREGVYVAPEKGATVAKDEGPTKKELLAVLRDLAPEISSEGIQNATKDALVALIARLNPSEVEAE